MNFRDCFIDSIESQVPSNESLQFLTDIMEKDRKFYLSNLLNLINEDNNEKIKISAAKTIPSTFLPFSWYAKECNDIYITLQPFLQLKNEFGEACRSSLIKCLSHLETDDFEPFLSSFIQQFDENTNIPLMMEIILNVLKISRLALSNSSIETIYNIIQQYNDENTTKICLQLLCYVKFDNEVDIRIFEIIENFYQNFPNEISEIMLQINEFVLINRFPDIIQNLYSLFLDSPIYNPYLRNLMRYPEVFYSEADFEFIYKRIIPELFDVEFDSIFNSLFANFTDECYITITNNPDTKEEDKNLLFSYAANAIIESINSESVSGFICAVKAYICLIDLDTSINEFLPYEQFIDMIPFGENSKLNELFILLQSVGIRCGYINATEEVINNIFHLFICDDERYHQLAEIAISNISYRNDQELHAIIWEFLSNCLSSDESTSDFLLSTFDVMKNVSKNLDPIICERIFPDVAKLHEILLNSNETGIFISKYLNILSNLIKNIGKNHVEFSEQALEIISKCIDGYEEDCIESFNIIIGVLGNASKELLNCCFNLIKERFGDDTYKQNEEGNKLLDTIISATDDEEFLFDIAQYIIQPDILTEDNLLRFGSNLILSVLLIYRKIPQKFSELFEQISEIDDIFKLLASEILYAIPSEKKEYFLNAFLDLKEESRANNSCLGDTAINDLTEQFPNYAKRIRNCFGTSTND